MQPAVGGTHARVGWLLDLLEAQATRDPSKLAHGGRAIVWTASARAAAALRRAVLRGTAERSVRGLFGVDFVGGAVGLARACLHALGEPAAEPLDPVVERAVLGRMLRSDHFRGDPLAAYALGFPGALEDLRRTLDQWLRHGASWPPGEEGRGDGAAATARGRAGRAGTERGASFARIAAAWRETSERLPTRSGLLDAAVQAVRTAGSGLFAQPLPRLVAVAAAQPPDAEVARLLDALRAAGARVETAPDEVAGPPRVTARVSHGTPWRELRAAAAGCLEARARAASAGRPVDWTECVVAVASLGRYRDDLERAFAAEGVPFSAAVEVGVGFEPRGALARRAATMLWGEPSRHDWLAWLTSPLLRDAPPRAEFEPFDRKSRDSAMRGVGATFERCVPVLERAAPRATARLQQLHARVVAERAAEGSAAERLDALRRLLAEELLAPAAAAVPDAREATDPDAARDAAVAARLDEGLAVLASAHALADATGDVPVDTTPSALLREVHELLDRRGLPLAGSVDEGVQVVEWRTAAELPAAHVEILGLDDGALDAACSPHGAAWIEDGAREGYGLRSKAEERAALLGDLAAAVRRAAVSAALRRPRTTVDDRTPLESAQALARIEEQVGAPLPEEEREPLHVRSMIEHRMRPPHGDAAAGSRPDSDAALPPDLAVTAAALDRADADACAGLADAADRPRLVRTHERAVLLARFDADRLEYDGDIGPGRGRSMLDDRVSVSSLGTLAECPHKFFFDRGLGIRPLPDEPAPFGIPGSLAGNLVHRALELVWRRWIDEDRGVPGPDDLSRLGDDFERMLDRVLREEDLAAAVAVDTPGPREAWRRRWVEAARASLAEDVADLQQQGLAPFRTESGLETVVPVRLPGPHAPETGSPAAADPAEADATPRGFRMRGKADRIDRAADGSMRIVDFKTGKNPQDEVKPKNLLLGRKLQLWLYARMVETGGIRAQDAEEDSGSGDQRSSRRGFYDLGTVDASPGEQAAAATARTAPVRGSDILHVRPGREDDALLRLPQAMPRLLDLADPLGREIEDTYRVLVETVESGVLVPSPETANCSWCAWRLACRHLHGPSAERVREADRPALAAWRALAAKGDLARKLGKASGGERRS